MTVSTLAQIAPPDTTSRACQVVNVLADEELSTEAAEDVAMNLDEVAGNLGFPSEARSLLLTVVHTSRLGHALYGMGGASEATCACAWETEDRSRYHNG